MKITESQLRKIIKEELASEGVFGDIFGSRKKKEFGYKWQDKPLHKMTPAEQEKYIEFYKTGSQKRQKGWSEEEATRTAADQEKKSAERAELDAAWRKKQPALQVDPEAYKVPGYHAVRNKLTREQLEGIVHEVLKTMRENKDV